MPRSVERGMEQVLLRFYRVADCVLHGAAGSSRPSRVSRRHGKLESFGADFLLSQVPVVRGDVGSAAGSRVAGEAKFADDRLRTRESE